MPSPARVRQTAAQVGVIGESKPVRTAELLAEGVTSAQLKAAARARTITALHRGIWLPTAVWSEADYQSRLRLAICAAMQAFPDSCVSHETARELIGLPSLGSRRDIEQATRYPLDHTPPTVPLVNLTRPGTRIMRGRIVVRDAPLCHDWVVDVDGLPVTDAIRTALDCAGRLQDPDALALLDAGCRAFIAERVGHRGLRNALHESRVPIDWRQALAERFEGRRPWRDAGRIAGLLSMVDPAAESPLESISRWNMSVAGLPMPRCGVPIRVHGGQVWWADFCWKSARVIGEADGSLKYTSPADLLAEKRRQESLEQAGWRVVRWDWNEGVVTPALMVGRLKAALAS
jgi:hypothetical protein